jgi:hypothetical protein
MSYCVNIIFTAASPAPADGYRVRYRLEGTLDPYGIVTGSSSPITICGLEDGENYEILLDSDCGDTFSEPETVTVTPPDITTTTSTSTTSTSSTTTTTTPIIFDTILTFEADTQDSDQGVTGTVAAISATTKFEFNLVTPRVGLPTTMLCNVNDILFMVVDYYSDYEGDLFRLTTNLGNIFYGNFTNGTVNFYTS